MMQSIVFRNHTIHYDRKEYDHDCQWCPPTNNLGTQDLSTRALVTGTRGVAYAPAKNLYLRSRRVQLHRKWWVGDSRTQMYGEDSFDLRKKYANHATVLRQCTQSQR